MHELSDATRQNFEKKLLQLIKVVDLIPGAVIVHQLSPLIVKYMCPWGTRNLGVELDEVVGLTNPEYQSRFFNPDDAKDYVPRITAMIERGDEEEVVTFFQQVRIQDKSGWSWYLSTSKIFMKDEYGKPCHLITVATPLEPLNHVTSKVNRLLEEKNFLLKNQAIFEGLTKREKEILGFMARGKNSLEISQKLFISEATVETHRKHIRKKIGAHTQYDVVLFAQSFDLI